MRASLYRADLSYGHGLVLHTASSGSIAALEELYLRLDAGDIQGVGAVRVNIAYLNHLLPEEVTAAALQAVRTTDWSADPKELQRILRLAAGTTPPPVRMLIDMALHDLMAKQAGAPVSAMLAHGSEGRAADRIACLTNQTLFWSPMDGFIAQAKAYVARGFTDLKIRVGVGGLDEDMRRIGALRDLFGADVRLAADANGQWRVDDALAHITALAPFGLTYIEQPIAPGDWRAISDLAAASPIPLMLDESLTRPDDIDSVCALKGRIFAHLKLVKLGGIAPTVAAARRLAEAGVPFMIGQMNEGGVATAAALQVAAATRPAFAELYGADGLDADPASGVLYRNGAVSVAAEPGLGIEFDVSKTTPIGAL